MRIKRHIIAAAVVLFAATASAACSNIKLIADYDESFANDIVAAHKKLEAFLNQLDAVPFNDSSIAYPKHVDFYVQIKTEVSSLLLRASAKPKNKSTEKMLTELRNDMLRIFEAKHKKGFRDEDDKRESIKLFRDGFGSVFRVMLELEYAKRTEKL